MQNTGSNYNLLLRKLDEFTRKYYLNQIIRGSLYSIGGILLLYLLISILEYQFYFSTEVRKLMFFGFLAVSIAALAKLVIAPLSKYFSLGNRLNKNEAARIIGAHFPEIEDRLLNVLELKELSKGKNDQVLIEASIDQKIDNIKPIPFSLAIDLSKNKKYLPYAFPPLLLLVFILFAAPNLLKESNYRLIKNSQYFEKEAPFNLDVINQVLEVVQYEDFDLQVDIVGNALPEDVYLRSGEYQYRLGKSSPSSFSHQFKKVQQDVDFYLEANGFRSRNYRLKILPKPMILQFDLEMDYPSYTGKKDEVLRNIGDAVIPAGTIISWRFKTENAEQIGIRFSDSLMNAERRGDDVFFVQRTFYSDEAYKIGVSNPKVNNPDSIAYRIDVIQDLYPNIKVDRYEDSLNNQFLYFLGEAGDDYGLSKLLFKYKIEAIDALGEYVIKEENDLPIKLDLSQNNQQFTYSWDMSIKDLKAGDRVTYFFELWDNDRVNGSKSSRSPKMVYQMPTEEEVEQLTEESNKNIKEDLESTLDEIQEVKEEISELKEKLLQKKQLNWEDKKAMEDLLKKQKNIEEQVEDIKEQFDENMDLQSQFEEEVSERLKEKQEKLKEMFDELLTEELRELFDELEKLMEEISKEQSLDELDNMELTDEQLENELDRMLELFKQMELQQKMEETIDELEQLAEEQEDLSEETGSKESEQDDLEQKQENINEKFEEIKEDLSQIQEMNEEMENKNDMESTEKKEEEISESLEQSMEELKDGKMKKASEQQKQSSQQMQELAQQMQEMMQSMEMQQMGEDMQALRQLLDNLIKLSFDQEQLIDNFAKTRINNPQFVDLVQQQYKLKEDAEMVEDSLIALSKRVFEISTFVTREIGEINKNMDKGLEYLHDRQTAQASVNQQLIMTGLNNLALMLDEVLQQMQAQMAMQMSGNQMCQKPNGNSSQLPAMGDLQKQLNEQISQMKQQMQNKGKSPMSKELAQMAARQAAIRDAMQKLAQEFAGDSESDQMAKELRELAEQMEKTEEDLVNKRIEEEMLKRQEEILTRLLEAAEAERERELDPERKSEEGEQITRELPPSLEEYLKKRQSEIDMYKTVPANLKPYYRSLVEEYIKGISF